MFLPVALWPLCAGEHRKLDYGNNQAHMAPGVETYEAHPADTVLEESNEGAVHRLYETREEDTPSVAYTPPGQYEG